MIYAGKNSCVFFPAFFIPVMGKCCWCFRVLALLSSIPPFFIYQQRVLVEGVGHASHAKLRHSCSFPPFAKKARTVVRLLCEPSPLKYHSAEFVFHARNSIWTSNRCRGFSLTLLRSIHASYESLSSFLETSAILLAVLSHNIISS